MTAGMVRISQSRAPDLPEARLFSGRFMLKVYGQILPFLTPSQASASLRGMWRSSGNSSRS
jgi:hypothetical protein